MAKILLVDDDEDILTFLEIHLTGSGYSVNTCLSGQAALDTLGAFKPDVIITDLNMPEMSGFDLMKVIRAERRVPEHCPIIFLTAQADASDVVQGLREGADDYLTKPINIDMLQAKLIAILRHVARINERIKQDQVKLYRGGEPPRTGAGAREFALWCPPEENIPCRQTPSGTGSRP
jgi:DNA-binding response OmpR family regulator